ncbi:uncharacterized protein ARMOST_10131 [Armillaria ostoyae]|uniref:DUF6534 domain-containing protein n=1 Tax=Armillaria ostoyae TaxID=47428 RepID=A0A284RDF2_ARMOS|nr:uncharacterized protein ARMOST_10131 [Armillaria ostoyae]
MQLISRFLGLILYGILCDQVCQWSYHYPHVLDCPLLTSFKDIYYISFPKDNLPYKTVVYVLWLTETVGTGSNMIDTFDTFCYNFGNVSALDDIHLIWFTVPILSGFVACISQLFYAWRMYKFSKKARWLCIILSVLSRAQTGLKSTRILLSRLIRLTIETGTITAAIAAVHLALFLSYNNNYPIVPANCLIKMYANTVLAVCNSRMTRRIRGGREDTTLHSFDSFDLSIGGLNIELRDTETNTNADSSLRPEFS